MLAYATQMGFLIDAISQELLPVLHKNLNNGLNKPVLAVTKVGSQHSPKWLRDSKNEFLGLANGISCARNPYPHEHEVLTILAWHDSIILISMLMVKLQCDLENLVIWPHVQ